VTNNEFVDVEAIAIIVEMVGADQLNVPNFL
jgi:hypothetical protein